jgi:hypothetical protein
MIPPILRRDECVDVDSDKLTGVDDRDNAPPFAFIGKIDRIGMTIDRPKRTAADEKKRIEAERNNTTSE